MRRRDFITVLGGAARAWPPCRLPVQAPTKFELVINLEATKARGLTVSRETQLIAEGDRVKSRIPGMGTAASVRLVADERLGSIGGVHR